jgi:hypothetical protein
MRVKLFETENESSLVVVKLRKYGSPINLITQFAYLLFTNRAGLTVTEGQKKT